VRELMGEVGLVHKDKNNFRADFRVKRRVKETRA
jgi:hypothetical protein